MARTMASCLVLALLMATGVHSLYPTTGCDGEPAAEPTTAKASPPDPILMASWILGYDPRLAIDSATLLGATSAASLLDTCQGPIYDELVKVGSNTVAAFTTGNGILPSLTPQEGSDPDGRGDGNFAANDRYTVETGTAGLTGTGTEYGPVCTNNVGVEDNDFETSGLKISTTATADGSTSFNYLFMSDEYPEYVGREYKDQMRIFVRINGGEYTNLALINGEPVGIDTVNSVTNSDNFLANDPSLLINGQTPYPNQYDGITTLLTSAPLNFVFGDKFDIVFMVNDCSDRLLDSAILVQSKYDNPPPTCFPVGGGVVISPDPSFVGQEVTITFSAQDDSAFDIVSLVCTTPDGVELSCTPPSVLANTEATVATCSWTIITTAADYQPAVSCVATDSKDQTAVCTNTPSLLPPSPSPAPPSPSPAPPSPSPAPPPGTCAGDAPLGGKCGSTSEPAGQCCQGEQCCSEYGYCGVTADHCGATCQPAFSAAGSLCSSGNTPLSGFNNVAYYPTWSDTLATSGSEHMLAKLAPYVNIVILSFMKPDGTFNGVICPPLDACPPAEWDGTGLQFTNPPAGVRDAVALMKAKGQRVLLAVGGATYNNWAALNPTAIKAVVDYLNLDGIDIDYEAPAGCTISDGQVSCDSDAGIISAIDALRTALPDKLVTAAVWSTGAYGEGNYAAAQPAGQYTGMWLKPLRDAGSKLDMIHVMSYDAGVSFDPKVAYDAYRELYAGAINAGISIPPEAWGGHEYTVAVAYDLAQNVVANAGNGMMLWSLLKPGTPSAAAFLQAACGALALGGCDAPLFG